MRNEAARNLTFETPDALWQDDRVGAGMQRWRREFPDVDCSGKAIVGRLLHLNEVFQAAINRTLARHRLKYPSFAVLATLPALMSSWVRVSTTATLSRRFLTASWLRRVLPVTTNSSTAPPASAEASSESHRGSEVRLTGAESLPR